jgi:hypothetical protein
VTPQQYTVIGSNTKQTIMTKYFSILFLAIATLMFSACKDNEDPTPANEMELDGTTLKITNAYVNSWSSPGKTNYGVFFATEGMLLEDKGSYDEFTGTGKMFYLGFSTTSADGLPAAEYTDCEGWLIGIEDGSWVQNDFYSKTTPITVVKSGDTYTFEFTINKSDASGVVSTVKLYYKGELHSAAIAL